ncbi:MAG: hypothetical protein LBE12_18065 [Planctomycetaceae bacterium]|jgi:hypothetical protein|nr:hypothetical protein [Planctomycetaceae bacterium]
MKISGFICRFAVIVLIFGIFGVYQVLPQSLETKQYRKPSESDIEWILGNPKTPSSNQNAGYTIPPCEPVHSVLPTMSPKQTKTPPQQNVSQITSQTDSQTAGEIIQTAAPTRISATEFSENFPSKEQRNETTAPQSKNGKLITNLLPKSKHQSVTKSKPQLIPKFPNTQTSFSVSEYLISDGTIMETLPETQDIFDEIPYYSCDNNFYRFCTDWGVPAMVGDNTWISGRSVGVTLPEQKQSVFFSVPTLLLSRLNLAEHFNAEIKKRIWFDYRQLNNATSINATNFRNSRAVNQFTFGFETCLSTCSSIEVRVPFFEQFTSKQLGLPNNQSAGSATELGNLSLIFKYLLLRSNEFTFSGGLGVVFPTAENWRLSNAMLKNKAYYLVPYLGLQWHPSENLFGHFLVQTDISVSENELRFNNNKVNINESTIVRLSWQLGRWFYRNELGSYSCRLGGFLELDWTITTDHADNRKIADNDEDNVFVSSTANKPKPLNIVMGLPVMFGQLTITNAVILPITNNNRSFSAGYDFSLSRCF